MCVSASLIVSALFILYCACAHTHYNISIQIPPPHKQTHTHTHTNTHTHTCTHVYTHIATQLVISNLVMMSPLHVAPPGPPRNFKTQVLSETEILLTWSNVLLLADILEAYEICFNALTPMCVDDSPVSAILAELHLSIFDTVVCVCVCVCVCACACVRACVRVCV